MRKFAGMDLCVFVSTEDDVEWVAGGIGTYLGILTRGVAKAYPDTAVVWITVRPRGDLLIVEGNLTIHYLAGGAPIEETIIRMEHVLLDLIAGADPSASILIEAPEWQGLMSDFYAVSNDPRVTKLTRLHSPLELTGRANNLEFGQLELDQCAREKSQVKHSNVLSSPTQFLVDTLASTGFLTSAQAAATLVIPNCINTQAFRPSGPRNGADLRRKSVFIIGSVERRKGAHLVAQAIGAIEQRHPEATFHFVGNVYEEQKPRSLNMKLSVETLLELVPPHARSKVHVDGPVPYEKMPAILAKADLCVVPYLKDNFPGVVAEIGLMQRPLAVVMRGGIPEMVTDNGVVLAMTIPGDSEETLIAGIAASVNSYFDDPEAFAHLPAALADSMARRFSEPAVLERMSAALFGEG